MKLAMISAMYENGGNTTHRHLDGHPELFCYPFESQLGTRFTNDELLSFFPFKYRWPVFPLEGSIEGDFRLFFDEEFKTRVLRQDGSKFRDADLQVDENERKAFFVEYMKDKERTTGNLVMAFFSATFKAWKNYNTSGKEKYFLGYSPIIGVDAEKMIGNLPDMKIIHVVRHPLACFAETRRRPFPLSLQRYTFTWNLVQERSLLYAEKYPNNYYVVRYEDLILDSKEAEMKKLAEWLDIDFNESMLAPSFNGKVLDNIYPWGTIDFADMEEQNKRISEIPDDEKKEILWITKYTRAALKYDS